MVARAMRLAPLVALLLLTGCDAGDSGPTTPGISEFIPTESSMAVPSVTATTAPTTTRRLVPGTFCKVPGMTGRAKGGQTLTCRKATDGRYRWVR
jgi:hypothetical protein